MRWLAALIKTTVRRSQGCRRPGPSHELWFELAKRAVAVPVIGHAHPFEGAVVQEVWTLPLPHGHEGESDGTRATVSVLYGVNWHARCLYVLTTR